MIRVVVVDDEPLARERVCMLLASHPDATVVAECGDGLGAVDAIARLVPDLVFLDIQMPELDGFEVLDALPAGIRPAVIFTTAYDAHALRGFEVNAVDYLLKPIDDRRFAEALQRARRAMPGAAAAQQAALEAFRRTRGHATRLVARDGPTLTFVPVDAVDWIEARGNYVVLHVGKATHTVRSTLQGLLGRLDPERFVRVHRSTVVQLDRIRTVEPYFHGEHVIRLADGTSLRSSRSHSAALREWLR